MHYCGAVVFALLFFGGVLGQNFSFSELYEIPGADFVGFGYDVRYTEPIQAVHLPLFEWDYQEVKTYRYPAHKEYRFRVPDELFVRTVARTDAHNYVFGNTDEMRQQFALRAGVDYKSEKTGATTDDLSSDEKDDLLAAATAEAQSNSNQTEEIDFEEAGYGKDPFMSVTETTTGTRAFSLGAEFSFLKENVDQTDRWITLNDQITQFYQLFADKKRLRPEFLEDVNRLKNRSWYSEDRELYTNFFEKYGTHVVVSAMMGGAISMTSVVERTAQTDTTNIESSITFQYNETFFSENNETITEEFIRDSPECRGDERGWTYRTVLKECIPPGELTCYVPMEQLQEEFDSLEPSTANWAFNRGPDKRRVLFYQNYVCNRFRWNRNQENVILQRVVDENDPFNPENFQKWTGETNFNRIGETKSRITVQYLRTVEFTGYVLRVEGKNYNWPLPAPVFSTCFRFGYSYNLLIRMNPQVNFGNHDEVLAFVQELLRVRPLLETCTYQDRCLSINPFFETDANITSNDDSPSPGEGSYLTLNSQSQFLAPISRRGRVIRLKNSGRPKLFQFDVRSDIPTTGAHNFVDVVGELGTYADRTDGDFTVNERSAALVARIYFDDNKIHLVGQSNNRKGSYLAGQWISIGLELDWENSQVHLWTYDNGNEDLPRKITTAGFIAKATNVNAIYLYHRTLAQGSFDSFRFCNEESKAEWTPVSRASAVATSSSQFKQTLNGQIDFNFANEYSAFTFSQTSNYRLKGGDSAQVDLLDLRKKVSTFDTWKGTIIQNPAPVEFVLKTIDEIIPDEEQRPSMKEAIQGWMNVEEVREIIVDDSPDIPRNPENDYGF